LTPTTTILSSDGRTGSAEAIATVSGLAVTEQDFSATQGESFDGTVAAFTDNASNASSQTYTASINWGDGGSSTTGTVTSDGNGGWIVTGNYTYAAAGNYAAVVTVTASDDRSSADSNFVDVTSLTATGDTISPTQAEIFNGTVATFTDANTGTTAADYSASIDWGDGNTSTGVVSSNGSDGFIVTGSSTFANSGTFNPVVTITDPSGATASATVTANVAGIVVAGQTISPTQGQSFTGIVATFTDSGADASSQTYTAAINWGDGDTSTGVVASSESGGYTVTGTHTFGTYGTYTPTITVIASAGRVTAADGEADVAAAADISISGDPSVNEGAGYTLSLSAQEFGDNSITSWTINWGDGTLSDPDTQTIEGNPSSIEHTIAAGVASATITATATDAAGSYAADSSQIVSVLPAAPGNLTTVYNNDGSVTLNWTNDSDIATGFTISESSDGGTTYSDLGSTSEETDTYTISGLDSGTAYVFAVNAIGSGSGSASTASPAAVVEDSGDHSDDETLSGTPTPPALSGVAASDSEIDLTFTDPAADGSNLELEELGPTDDNFKTIGIPTLSDGVYPITGLQANTTYSFRVRADMNSAAVYSNTVTVTTNSSSSYTDAAPSGVSIAADSSSLDSLTFVGAPTLPSDATQFRLHLTSSSFPYGFPLSAEYYHYVNDDDGNFYITTPSTPGVSYQASVAYDNDNDNVVSDFSQPSNSLTVPGTMLPAPSALSIEDGVVSVNIPAGAMLVELFGANSIDQVQPTPVVFESETNGVPLAGGTYTQAATGLGYKYVFAVASYYDSSTSTYEYSPSSNGVNMNVTPTAPDAPANVAATAVSNSQINILWDNTPDNETGYYIYRSTSGNDTSPTLIYTANSDQTSYSDTGDVEPGVTYYYWVQSYNSVGDSAMSGPANATISLPTVSISTSTDSVTEGDDFTETISWTAGIADGQQVSVPIDAASGTGDAEEGVDYTGLPSQISFVSGAAGSLTLTVDTTNTTTPDWTTQIIDSLGAPEGSEPDYALATDAPIDVSDVNAHLGITLGDGSTNQILQASASGTQNLTKLQLSYPTNVKPGSEVKLIIGGPAGVKIWSTPNPGPTDQPLTLTGGSITWQMNSNGIYVPLDSNGNPISGGPTLQKTYYVGATAASANVNDVTFTLQDTDANGEWPSTDQTTTSPSLNTATADASAIKVVVATEDPANGRDPQSDWNGTTQNWLVGQLVDLKAIVQGPTTLTSSLTYSWATPPGNILHSWSGIGLALTPEPLQAVNGDGTGTSEQEIRFFWVSSAAIGRSANEAIKVAITMAGNQYQGTVNFDVYEPAATMLITTGKGAVYPYEDRYQAGLTAGPSGESLRIDGTVNQPDPFTTPGTWFLGQLEDPFVSLINFSGQKFHPAGWNVGKLGIDEEWPIADNLITPFNPALNASSWVTGNLGGFNDDPGLEFQPSKWAYASYTNTFVDYLMYVPPGAESTPVPLLSRSWSMYVAANSNGTLATIDGTAIPATPQILSGYPVSTEPKWPGGIYESYTAIVPG
jgi:hypothetical protein